MSGEGTACSTHPQRFPISGMLNHAAEVGRCAAQRPLFDPHKGPSSLGCSDRKPSGLSGLLLEKKSAGAKRPPAPQPADSLPVFRNPHLLLEIEADKPRAPTSFPLTSWGRATISQERRRAHEGSWNCCRDGNCRRRLTRDECFRGCDAPLSWPDRDDDRHLGIGQHCGYEPPGCHCRPRRTRHRAKQGRAGCHLRRPWR